MLKQLKRLINKTEKYFSRRKKFSDTGSFMLFYLMVSAGTAALISGFFLKEMVPPMMKSLSISHIENIDSTSLVIFAFLAVMVFSVWFSSEIFMRSRVILRQRHFS